MIPDDDWLTLSALEHYAYCPWQAWLLQDGVWADNHLTVQGSAAHDRVDLPGVDHRRGVRVHRAVPVVSHRHRIHGIADAVEETRDGTLMPVEHKWGRGAGDLRPLIVQATAQAICLEETLDVQVPSVAIYIVTERHRELVATADWRDVVLEVVAAARAELLVGRGPHRPTYQARRCRRCSLLGACQPQGES